MAIIIDYYIFSLMTAFTLDFLLGDPYWLPHPIRWMGRGIETLEPSFRRLPIPLIYSGALMAILLVSTTYLLALGLVHLSGYIHPILELIINIVLIFYCISTRSLDRSARDVLDRLLRKDLSGARSRVGLIVGRDTNCLDFNGIRRAVVETVAENFVDGVAAPLFYAIVGGAPLAMAYKMINTLDSMIGYENERYNQFGKFAAHLDDIANFLPARLAVPVISLAAHQLGRCGRRTFFTALSEGANHSSPNAGYPEAAFAGALAVRLNGPGDYGGKRVEKPFIGKRFGHVTDMDIQRACDLMLLSSVLWLGIITPACLVVQIFI